MKKRCSQKVILVSLIGLLMILALGSSTLFHREKHKHDSCVCSAIPSSKVRKIFSSLKKQGSSLDQCLIDTGALNVCELNQVYAKAVDLKEYDVAIKIYRLGATQCYDPGSDILLVALNAGHLGLADELLQSPYPVTSTHINAARSLINVDQANWAFIYQKEDCDYLGFSDYQYKSKKIANDIIKRYNATRVDKNVSFTNQSRHYENYLSFFGENPITKYQQEVERVLKEGYYFETATHGAQKRSILMDQEGKAIGIIKSRNEQFAYQIDRDHFAMVPPVIKINIKEYGETYLQKWVSNSKNIREQQISTEKASNQADLIEQLHHVRLLDLRLGNSDRNKGNLLVCKHQGQQQLFAIDHDLIMFYIPNDLNWQAPYLNLPFTEITKSYFASLDIEEDIQVMVQLGYPFEDIQAMMLRSALIKLGIENNLKLKEIDLIFRFYYYDFLDMIHGLSKTASLDDYIKQISSQFHCYKYVIQQPTEVWKLLENSFEFYI